MVTDKDKMIEKIKGLLKMLSDNGLHIKRTVLFGSYAKKQAGKWSDIDIAVVSEDFCGVPFLDRKRINPLILKIDSSIELHPFKPEDFTKENPFVNEIIKNGIEIEFDGGKK